MWLWRKALYLGLVLIEPFDVALAQNNMGARNTRSAWSLWSDAVHWTHHSSHKVMQISYIWQQHYFPPKPPQQKALLSLLWGNFSTFSKLPSKKFSIFYTQHYIGWYIYIMCMYINIYICIPSDILNFIRENNASPILGSDPRLEKKKT